MSCTRTLGTQHTLYGSVPYVDTQAFAAPHFSKQSSQRVMRFDFVGVEGLSTKVGPSLLAYRLHGHWFLQRSPRIHRLWLSAPIER